MISTLSEDELKQLVNGISAALSEHGPKGQNLAAKMMDAAGKPPFIQLVVAITLIRCYIEDCNDRESFGILFDTIYNLVRTQIDEGMGTPQ